MRYLVEIKTLICICIVIQIAPALGQKVAIEDYSIPDAPAFSIMNSTPTTILRPSTGREFVLALGNQFSSKQNSSIAFEYSPIKDFSLSVGIQNGIQGEASFGVRYNILDYINANDDNQVKQLRSFFEILNTKARSLQLKAVDSLMTKYTCDADVVMLDHIEEFNKLQNQYYSVSLKDPGYDNTIDKKFKKLLEDMSWNKSILSIALAYRNNYSGLSIGDISFNHDNKFQLWCTYSLGLGKIFKLDIGTTGGFVNIGDTNHRQFGFGLKGIYAPANFFRCELGIEFKYNDNRLNDQIISIERPVSGLFGVELRVSDNQWIVFQLAKEVTSTKYIPKIEYKTGL